MNNYSPPGPGDLEYPSLPGDDCDCDEDSEDYQTCPGGESCYRREYLAEIKAEYALELD
jgi:hypothetical protein